MEANEKYRELRRVLGVSRGTGFQVAYSGEILSSGDVLGPLVRRGQGVFRRGQGELLADIVERDGIPMLIVDGKQSGYFLSNNWVCYSSSWDGYKIPVE